MGAPRDTFKNHDSAGTTCFTPESPMILDAASTGIDGTSTPPTTSSRSDAVPPVIGPGLSMMNSGRREGQPAPEQSPPALSLA